MADLAAAADPAKTRARADGVTAARATLDAAQSWAAERAAAAAADLRRTASEHAAAKQVLAEHDRTTDRLYRAAAGRDEARSRHDAAARLAEAIQAEPEASDPAAAAREALIRARAERI